MWRYGYHQLIVPTRSTWQKRTLEAARKAAVGASWALTALGFARAADGLPTEITHNVRDVIAKAPLQYTETHDHARFLCQYGLSGGDGSELLREGIAACCCSHAGREPPTPWRR